MIPGAKFRISLERQPENVAGIGRAARARGVRVRLLILGKQGKETLAIGIERGIFSG